MNENMYSSGLISQCFWFVETKKIIRLLEDGISEEDIKKSCIDTNLFGVTKEYRARRIYGYIWNRVKHLDQNLIALFISSDLATQKIINLIAILKSDRLFFEFLYEVYREKNMLGVQTLTSSDVNIFFNNKDIQNENIARWTDSTKRRLGTTYLNFMTDANLLAENGKERMLTPPILDIALERYLEASGNVALLKAITGVN